MLSTILMLSNIETCKIFFSFCCFLAIKLFLVKDFRNNEFIIVLLTGLPLVVAFFLDQWLHCGVPLWILYSLFCVQAGDSWSSQYLLVFRLHLHHCVSFLLVDRWDIGIIYSFNLSTFIHYACVQVKEIIY